ncbi:hypothetical protein BpHYR1_033094 [Brachionus plicatilis]|uniref:Uncharacterized protein n=1 Tax=Brachionus plicatilis TaxID=10195 RepID=A0A3M7PZP8_BRAPC|nr:hypothetical protein BpHYR1_033094 [Brachionus plicatilis]
MDSISYERNKDSDLTFVFLLFTHILYLSQVSNKGRSLSPSYQKRKTIFDEFFSLNSYDLKGRDFSQTIKIVFKKKKRRNITLKLIKLLVDGMADEIEGAVGLIGAFCNETVDTYKGDSLPTTIKASTLKSTSLLFKLDRLEILK